MISRSAFSMMSPGMNGNPFVGGEEINNPTGANLQNVNELWAHVADDYCENSIRVPFTILPQPDLHFSPPDSCLPGRNCNTSIYCFK